MLKGYMSGTCHMRHALWTGITAGVLGLERVLEIQQPVTILAFIHETCTVDYRGWNPAQF